MAGWGQGSSEQQLRPRLPSQHAAESLLGLDKVLCWHGLQLPDLKWFMWSQHRAQLPLLHLYLLEEPAPVPPRKSELFSQWKLKKILTIPPVPVLKTLPAFHKMNRRKNFLSTSCLFFIYSFPPPKWDLCLSAVAAQLPLAKWDPRNRKQGQEFSSDFW